MAAAVDEGMPVQGNDEEITIDFGDFIVEGEVGKGSFGIVYKASYFGSEVALKQLRYPDDTPDFSYDKYIKREVAVQKSMRHPNIVRFVGVSYHDNTQWIITEYVAGGNLHKLLKNSARELSWRSRIKLAQDIASAMAYLQSRKILFRDLKTKNVLIEETGPVIKALLCDFGFARAMNRADPAATSRKLKALTICGTDDYMAPEVIMGMEYNEKADVFSYGIVLLELITRKKAEDVLQRQPQTGFDFEKDEVRSLFASSDKDQQTKYPGQGPCPPLFAELFFACCAYNPADRPAFKDILVILNKISKEVPGGPSSPGTPPHATTTTTTPSPASSHIKPSASTPANTKPVAATATSNNIYNNNNNTNNKPTASKLAPTPDEEVTPQTKNKFTDLQEALLLHIQNIDSMVNVLASEVTAVSNEKDIMNVRPQCRIIIEIKEFLSEIVSPKSVVVPPVEEDPNDNTRFGLFKRTIIQSIAQIHIHLHYLKGIVSDGSKYAQLVPIGKTVREIKKLLDEFY